jgi:sugar phosphate isomerase/epimerase
MKLGICLYSYKEHPMIAQKIGFDYFEYPFSEIVAMTDEEFDSFRETIQKLKFYPEVMIKFLESSQHLTGDEVNIAALREYCVKGFARCSQIGTKGFVFGSDGARNLPLGFTDRMKGYEQLADFLLMVSDLAQPYGYHFYIEPLTMKKDKGANIISFIGEAIYLALRTNRENVKVMVDYYHSTNNFDSMEMIPLAGKMLEHFHFSSLDRKYPRIDDGFDYADFFRVLKSIKYNGRISIEAKTPDNFEQAASLAYDCMRFHIQ